MNLRCSGLLTASGLVNTGRTKLQSILMLTNGTNDLTVIVYDNTAASGTVHVKYKVPGAALFGSVSFDKEFPLWFETGLYVSLAGTGGEAIVYYTKEHDF